MAGSASRRISPELVVAAGCAIALITAGPRATAGLFQIPMTTEYGWGRDVFSLAIALQNLLWGVGQPFAGAVADRFGAVRVICAGAILYALGLAVMAYAATPGLMHLGAGVLIGFGLSGSSFNLILGAFGKLLPPEWRPLAFGAGTAAGSLGQFFFPPVAQPSHRRLRLAPGARRLCRHRARCDAVLARARPPRRRAGRRRPGGGLRASRSRRRSPRPSGTAATCCSCSASSPAASSSPSSPRICRPSSRTPGCPASVGGWTLAVIGLANAVGSLSAGLAVDPHAEALAPRLDLSRALGRDRGLHPDADLAPRAASSSASPWACYGSRRCRRPRRS